MPPTAKPAVELFLPKIRKGSDDECWLWQVSVTNKGYGLVQYRDHGERRTTLAHRFAWELWVGPIPPGLEVCHRCDTPRCVNPNHLFLGTHTDNMRDASLKKKLNRQTATHCVNGHEFTEANTYRYPKTGLRSCQQCRARWSAAYTKARWAEDADTMRLKQRQYRARKQTGNDHAEQ